MLPSGDVLSGPRAQARDSRLHTRLDKNVTKIQYIDFTKSSAQFTGFIHFHVINRFPAGRSRRSAPIRAVFRGYQRLEMVAVYTDDANNIASSIGEPRAKISIIMPSYNWADTSERAIRSTQAQTEKLWRRGCRVMEYVNNACRAHSAKKAGTMGM